MPLELPDVLTHAIGSLIHAADTLSDLNARISDADMDDAGDLRDPNIHAASHQNGGGDQISVAGLSGVLGQAQTALAHALVSAFHTASGLTPGDVLTALTASTFGFLTPAGGGGVVEQAIDHTYEGNQTGGRKIDLGDNYDLILIFLEEARATSETHFALAYAFRECYGLFQQVSVGYCRHYAMSDGDTLWQGKLFGGDINKIGVGSAASSSGTNGNGLTYRLVGFKFSSME